MAAKLKHLQNKKNTNCDVCIIIPDSKRSNSKQALISNYNFKKEKTPKCVKAKVLNKSQDNNFRILPDEKIPFYYDYYEYIDQEERDINKTVKFLDWYLKEKKLSSNK